MDFVTLAMDQIVNQAVPRPPSCSATAPACRWSSELPHGGGIAAGPQHSQCLEAWFAHIPGLKVVAV